MRATEKTRETPILSESIPIPDVSSSDSPAPPQSGRAPIAGVTGGASVSACSITTAKRESKAFRALSGKHQMFVVGYLTHFNATRAAKDAGYSPGVARSEGSRLLTYAYIAEAIHELLDAYVSEDVIEANIAEIALQTDIADFEGVFEGTRLSELRDAGVPTHRIKQIKATRRTEGRGENSYEVEDVTLQLHDRMAALESLARIKAMFQDRVKHEFGEKPIEFTFQIGDLREPEPVLRIEMPIPQEIQEIAEGHK